MTDTPDLPKYLPGLEGDPEAAILDNWTEQDWGDGYEASVATVVGGGMLLILTLISIRPGDWDAKT